MERIAIFAALQWECRAVLRALRQVRRVNLGGVRCWRAADARREVLVVKTGVGIERAAAAAAAIDAASFSALIATGCAGGLAPDLQPGDLAVATSVRLNASDHATDDALRASASSAARAAGLRMQPGRFLCHATVLATAAQKRAAADDGAVAVDMESGAIAAHAAAAGVPCLAVRVVLDGADHELPIPESLMDPAAGRVRPLALAAYLATHPAAIADLRALQRMQRVASVNLERFFAAWLAEPAGADDRRPNGCDSPRTS